MDRNGSGSLRSSGRSLQKCSNATSAAACFASLVLGWYWAGMNCRSLSEPGVFGSGSVTLNLHGRTTS